MQKSLDTENMVKSLMQVETSWKTQILLEPNLDIYAVVPVRFFHFKLCPGAINSAVRTCFKLQFSIQYVKVENQQKLLHQVLSSRNLKKASDQEIYKSLVETQ